MNLFKHSISEKKWQLILAWLFIFPFLQLKAYDPQLSELPFITLNQRQLCDLELIFNEGFHPLTQFMGSKDYNRVVEEMRLADGTVWPMPIVLDVPEKKLDKIKIGSQIALRDLEGFVLATVTVEEIWKPNKEREAEKVYGTTNPEHPGVYHLFNYNGDYYIAGPLTLVSMPKHYDFTALRRTPAELKALFKEKGITKVVAFQTRNPMHRAHLELTFRASSSVGAHLLIHPAVGMTNVGDVDYFTRVKCYQKLLPYYPEGSATLSLLPIAMRMAGPREALWHAIIRKNYGCTHFIVGRDHAGPGKDSTGRPFYGPYEAQELVKKYSQEIGIEVVPFKEMVYVKEDNNYQPVDEVEPGKTTLNLSGTQLRELLNTGAEIPDWFSFPTVVEELRKVYPPRGQQGFTLFFTGLPASGKSTLANALSVKLMEIQERPLTVLDGDIIRTHLSSELGFSKEHRSINVRRVGFVASEISKNRGIAICALIAPYEQDRFFNRNLIDARGNYIEVYVATPLDVCEERDTKGLYALAKEGKITGFTGVDDPYEVPKNPEITIDTSQYSITEAINLILDYLRHEKFIN
jgi:sulfate adenylyltransferase